MGAVLSKEEINQYICLYSSPKLIEEYFFDFETLYEKLLDEEGEVRKLKVSLAIINLERWSKSRLKTRVAANMLMFTEKSKLGFGLVHVAILIGQYIIHWFDDGLVHMTPIRSAHPNVAVEVGELDIQEVTDFERIKSLCYVISEYNTKMIYNNRSCNCHHFVRDCFHAMGFNLSCIMKGQLGSYLQKVRSGKLINEKVFINPITGRKTTFNSHQQLDEYTLDLFKKEPDFEELYPYDYKLLKSFDRGFWMGHLKDIHNSHNVNIEEEMMWNEAFLPLMRRDEHESKCEYHIHEKHSVELELEDLPSFKVKPVRHIVVCPFGDPTETGCFLSVDN